MPANTFELGCGRVVVQRPPSPVVPDVRVTPDVVVVPSTVTSRFFSSTKADHPEINRVKRSRYHRLRGRSTPRHHRRRRPPRHRPVRPPGRCSMAPSSPPATAIWRAHRPRVPAAPERGTLVSGHAPARRELRGHSSRNPHRTHRATRARALLRALPARDAASHPAATSPHDGAENLTRRLSISVSGGVQISP